MGRFDKNRKLKSAKHPYISILIILNFLKYFSPQEKKLYERRHVVNQIIFANDEPMCSYVTIGQMYMHTTAIQPSFSNIKIQNQWCLRETLNNNSFWHFFNQISEVILNLIVWQCLLCHPITAQSSPSKVLILISLLLIQIRFPQVSKSISLQGNKLKLIFP